MPGHLVEIWNAYARKSMPSEVRDKTIQWAIDYSEHIIEPDCGNDDIYFENELQ